MYYAKDTPKEELVEFIENLQQNDLTKIQNFFDTMPKIIKKIEAFAHSEFNIKEFKNKRKILKKIKNNEDLFDRNIFYKKINLDRSFPDYLVKNKDLYKKWII